MVPAIVFVLIVGLPTGHPLVWDYTEEKFPTMELCQAKAAALQRTADTVKMTADISCQVRR